MDFTPSFSPPTLEIRDRAIAPAVIQAARTWGAVVDVDPAPDQPGLAGVFLRCARCTQGMARLAYGEPGQLRPVEATVQDVEAGVLLHVLQVHRGDVDPEWSGT